MASVRCDERPTGAEEIGEGARGGAGFELLRTWEVTGECRRSSRTLRGSGGIPEINQQLTRAVCIGALRVHPVEGNASH